MKSRKLKSKIRRVIGIHSCLETLKVRPREIRSIHIQKTKTYNKEIKKIIEQARRFRVPFFEQKQLSSWGTGHQGVALIVEQSPQWSLKNSDFPTLIFIDGLEDPRNLGSIIRTSWLMGVGAVFLPSRDSIRQITATVCKSASGGAEHVPVEFLPRPYEWLKKIKKEGYWIYGLDPKGSLSLLKTQFSKPALLMAGSESQGLKNKTKSFCDELIHIPQKSKSGSYNLSVSVALGLQQISKTI